ncbi:hypothetical protein GCM10027049_19620 [Mucilaginibacter puniceus]
MKKYLSIILLAATSAVAQKLPNIQTTSLLAPATVKIDGRATEWNNELQAYNKSTDIYYTIANDGNNLYVTIRATDKLIMRKIILSGFTFAINKIDDGKKTLSILLPLFSGDDKYGLLSVFSETSLKNDSLIRILNSRLEKAKELRISGFDGINTESIPIYNEYDIQAKALFDKSNWLTYELAIPRKYIRSTSDKLNYTIQLNGWGTTDKNVTIERNPESTIIINTVARSVNVLKNTPENLVITSTTNLTADYELAE